MNDHVAAASDEDLAHERLFGSHGGRHGHAGVDRHVSPTQEYLAFSGNGSHHLLLARLFRSLLFGQEDHAHTVFARRGELHTLFGHLFTVQSVWDLNQNTSTVAHQFVGTHSTAVIQVLKDLQGLRDHVVTFVTFDVRHKTHTTGVVFLIGVVQTLTGEFLSLVSLVHGANPLQVIKS